MVFREFGNFVVKLPFVHLQVFENWQTTGIVLEQIGQILLDHQPRIEVHIVEHGIQIDVVSLDGLPLDVVSAPIPMIILASSGKDEIPSKPRVVTVPCVDRSI